MREMSRYQDTPIGPYRLTRLVGVGPVSRVYLAERQDWPGRRVALKLFEAVPFSSLEAKDQALDEIRLRSCLEHPALLPILDDGIHENMLYQVEPFCATGSLRQRLTTTVNELLPLKEVMALLLQVGEALQFAHTQQIVHANLKPENILFQRNGKVLLADFLLPSLVKSERAARILSTFAAFYMAPEQFQGVSTPLSDQYSLACLAYELLTGQPPFEADDFMSLARKHATKEPKPASQLQPGRTQHIDHALLKALVKRPEGRYPDIQTFLVELSAPPPLAVLDAPEESLLTETATAFVGPDPAAVTIKGESEGSAFPATFAIVDGVFEQETVKQEAVGSIPQPLGPDVDEATTIVIPAAPGSLLSGKHASVLPPSISQALVAVSKRSGVHFSQKQIWLTAGIGVLALLISISGLLFFSGTPSPRRSLLQIHNVGATATSPATISSGTGLTPTAAGAVQSGSPTATATSGSTATPTTAPTATATPSPTSVKPTPTPTTPPPTPTPTPPVLMCTVNYAVYPQWYGYGYGYIQVNITITNTGTTTIHGWTLTFSFNNGEKISSGWSGHFTQNGAQVSISNASFNATLDPGASATPGFQARSSNGESNPPTSFSLNGVACQS